MKLIIALLVLMAAIGCKSDDDPRPVSQMQVDVQEDLDEAIIVKWEGHDMLYISGYYGGHLVHSPECEKCQSKKGHHENVEQE
jgi:hypothetical protein